MLLLKYCIRQIFAIGQRVNWFAIRYFSLNNNNVNVLQINQLFINIKENCCNRIKT